MSSDRRAGISRGLSSAEVAADWVVKRQGEDLSPEEEAAFQAWLNESAQHRDIYRRTSETWSLFDDVEADPHIRVLRAAALEDKPSYRVPIWFGLAASVLVVFGVTAHLELAGSAPAPTAEVADGTIYHTAKGQRLNFNLPDGTAVLLNTDSALTVQYSDAKRLVNLTKGEAYFEVVKNKARPFVVAGGGKEVTALGTQFEVHVDDARTQVLLVEGKVWVAPQKDAGARAGGSHILMPGEMLTTQAGSEIMGRFNVEQAMLWKNGLVEFDNRPLGEAIEEMNRYSPRPLIITDDRIAAMKISGVFKTGQADRFVEIVSEILPVQSRQTDSGIEIVRKGKS